MKSNSGIRLCNCLSSFLARNSTSPSGCATMRFLQHSEKSNNIAANMSVSRKRHFRGVPIGSTGVLGSSHPSPLLHQTLIANDSNENVIMQNVEEAPEQPEFGEKLYLTPLISSGRVLEAQQLARVQGLGEMDRILSYSGFLTVNEKLKSNIFFWFFPAVQNPETAPVLLWLNGGPGASSMFGLFSGHGPYFVDSNYQLQPRKSSWNRNHSVLYIDSPVGTGFSFTDGDGYARNLNEVVKDMYEALTQFFTLFPQFKANDFYITGQSYTGKYAPAIGHKIHTENKSNPEVRINLKGLAIGSGLCDPLTQVDYGEYLYNIGLIDEQEKSHFDTSYREVCSLIKEENWTEAHKILQHLVIGWPRPIVSRFETVTGYSFNSNYIYEDMPDRYAYYIPFLKFDYVRRAIHVGGQEFGKMRNKVYEELCHDFPQTVKPLVEELLNEKYKILFYASQLDIIVPHTGIDKFVNSLNWKGKEEYSKTRRNIWRVGNDVGGYSKEVDNLVHLLIRNAGHVAPHDQPEWCFDMITRFTRGDTFC